MAEAAATNTTTETPITPVAPVESGDSSYDQALGDAWERAMKAPDDGAEGNAPVEAKQESASRDEQGRFTRQNPVEASPPGGHAGEDDAAASSSERLAAPSSVPLYLAQVWQDIPEQHRGLIEKWASENNNKMADLGRRAAGNDMQPMFEDMVQSYPERFSGPEAISPKEAVEFLYSVQKDMDKAPVPTILEIASRYGVVPDLARALGVGGDQNAQVQALQHTIQQLEDRLANRLAPDTIRSHIQSAMTEERVSADLHRFASEKPFFADVESDLPQFIEIARSKEPAADPLRLLESAYEMAVNALPAVREKAQAASRAATVPDPRAAAAKKAASINIKSTANSKQKPRSQEEAMGDAYDRLMAQ
jgi:hypothetical protein